MYLRKSPPNDTVIGNLSYAYFKRGKYAQTLEVLSRNMHGDSNLGPKLPLINMHLRPGLFDLH